MARPIAIHIRTSFQPRIVAPAISCRSSAMIRPARRRRWSLAREGEDDRREHADAGDYGDRIALKKLWRPTRISSPERSGAHSDEALSQSLTLVCWPLRTMDTLSGRPISATCRAMRDGIAEIGSKVDVVNVRLADIAEDTDPSKGSNFNRSRLKNCAICCPDRIGNCRTL